jgi:Concanavalin A-like lectin/glucanases superfamily
MRQLMRGSSGRIVLGALVASVFLACAAPASAAPLGEWRFDEPDGQRAIDGGPFGLDGRLGDSTAADAADPQRIAGVSGGALRFGGGSLVRLPDSDVLAARTLTAESVVRAPASPGRYRYIVSRGSVKCFAGSYGLYTGTAGGVAFYVFDGVRYVVSAAARPEDVWDGAWHHVAGTFDGSALRMFVDGRPVGEPAVHRMQIDYSLATPSAAFGRYVGDCDLAFAGDLDMVRLSSDARTPEALAAAAASELQPGGGGLTGPRTPLPAATPPQFLDARTPDGRRPATTPGAPPRACTMRLSRHRVPARRKNVVRVRVTLRGRPVHAARVTVRRNGRPQPISSARTGARGRARLVIHVGRPQRVRITAKVRPSCAPGFVRVTRPR